MPTNNQSVPTVQTTDRNINQLQTNIITALNRILSNKILSNNYLENVSLSIGPNTINHKLGRELIGWFVIRQRASAIIYDTQDSNLIPEVTLSLNASAAVVVDLVVF